MHHRQLNPMPGGWLFTPFKIIGYAQGSDKPFGITKVKGSSGIKTS